MIKLISFSSVQKQLSMPSAILKSHCHNTAQLDWLILPATRSRKERKSRARADLANAGEFNRRYLVDQISAILNADLRRSRRSAKIAIAVLGTPGDFRQSPRSSYKTARCVIGFRINHRTNHMGHRDYNKGNESTRRRRCQNWELRVKAEA